MRWVGRVWGSGLGIETFVCRRGWCDQHRTHFAGAYLGSDVWARQMFVQTMFPPVLLYSLPWCLFYALEHMQNSTPKRKTSYP